MAEDVTNALEHGLVGNGPQNENLHVADGGECRDCHVDDT